MDYVQTHMTTGKTMQINVFKYKINEVIYKDIHAYLIRVLSSVICPFSKELLNNLHCNLILKFKSGEGFGLKTNEKAIHHKLNTCLIHLFSL